MTQGKHWFESATPLTAPDWERIKIEVRERIDALAATMSDRCNASPELKSKLWSDLVLPNVRLLAEFCANVTFDDADDVESGHRDHDPDADDVRPERKA